jgi:hypothetical protein
MTSAHKNKPESLSSARSVDGKLPRGIRVPGFVSLLMDVSSEPVHSLLPIFMTTVLGASIVTDGIIESFAEVVVQP